MIINTVCNIEIRRFEIIGVKLFVFIIFFSCSVLSSRVPRNDQDNFLIKTSYDEVTALVDKYFNSKCNLLLQNCIFQNQWERLFGHDKLFVNEDNKKRNAKSNFYYCQAFIVARFCIDDYLRKSYNDNYECLNGTNGNMPSHFKHMIHRNECKKYYTHFFLNNSFSSRNFYSSSAVKLYSYFSSKFIIFFKIIFFHQVFYLD